MLLCCFYILFISFKFKSMEQNNYQSYPLSFQHRGDESPQQQQQLINELEYRFKQKPRICKKLNDTFIGSSKRIVYVHDDTFFYYHLIQEFQDLDVGKLQYAIPKAGIKLKDIICLSFPPRKKKEKNYFTLTIPKNKILKYGKNKQIVVDPNAKGEQTWTFVFNYDIFSLPEKQERKLREEKKRLQLEMKKRENQRLQKQRKEKQQYEKRLEQQKRQRNFSKFLKLKDDQKNSSIKNIEQQKQKPLTKTTKKQKSKEQVQRDLALEAEIKAKAMAKKKLDSSFQYFFNLKYMKLNNALSPNQLMKIQYSLYQTIGNFRLKSIQAVKLLIDELIFQSKYRKYKQTRRGYNVNQIFVKIGGKQLNQQFLGMQVVSDILAILKKNRNIKIRVPLACLIKYKGYKALCITQIPINNQTLIYGVSSQNILKINSSISDELKDICKGLNLKPYQSQLGYTNSIVYLDPRIEVHRTQPDPFYQINKLAQSMNYSENSISSKMNPINNVNEKQEELIYLINLKQIFPIDIDLNKSINQIHVRLRPQLIHSMIEQPLSSGAFLYAIQDTQGQVDDVNVAKIGQLLRYKILPEFVKRLDNLEIIFIDSKNISQALKINGINVRYLGKIIKLTELPYIKQMLKIEAYARIIKKIFRQQIKDFNSKGFAQMHPQLFKLFTQDKNQISQADQFYFQSKKKQIREKYIILSNYMAVDFLNLVFGNTDQTYTFWKIIEKKAETDYQIEPEMIPPSMTYGALLHAVLYHCGFHIKFNTNVPLFNSRQPFKINDFVKYTVSSRVYQYPSFEIKKMANKSKQYLIDNKFVQLGINSLNLQLSIQRALQASVSYEHCASPQIQTLAKLANYVDIQIPECPICHPCNVSFYMKNISEDNFNQVHGLLQFSLPISHPLFITFYMQYSKLFVNQRQILYKSALIVAIRGLGVSHWKTCQLFSNIDDKKQNIEFLKKAWVGSKQRSGYAALNLANAFAQTGNILHCVQFCQKSANLFEEEGEKSYKPLIQVLILGLKSYYQLREIEEMHQTNQRLWKVLQVYDRENYDCYFILLWHSLKGFMETTPKKFYYYKLILVFKDHLEYQNQFASRPEKISYTESLQIEQVGEKSSGQESANFPVYSETFFAEADPILKLQILNKILKMLRESKSHLYWLRDTLSKVEYGYKTLNFEKCLWSRFQQLIQKLNNQQLQEGIQNFLLLAKLFGQKFFYDALIKDIFFRPNKPDPPK